MIPKKNRLKRSGVQYTLKKGHRISGDYFIIKYLPTRGEENRFSVSVSLKVSAKAVERNKLRRQLYEIIKNSYPDSPHHLNIVIIVKPEATSLSFDQLNENLIKILKKIHG